MYVLINSQQIVIYFVRKTDINFCVSLDEYVTLLTHFKLRFFFYNPESIRKPEGSIEREHWLEMGY